MKPIMLLLLMVAMGITLKAQNLVPNPGFEDRATCPLSYAGINGPYHLVPQTVLNWQSPTRATPDYFACSSKEAGVPKNFLGNVPSYNGSAYAGILAIGILPNDQHYEYLQVKLSQTLEKDSVYKVSCFVGCHISLNIASTYAMDRIHALLTYHPPNINGYGNLQGAVINLQTTSKDFIKPADGWTQISAYYKANGGEEWLTLGIFTDTGLNFSHQLTNNSEVRHYSYYSIDDVSVELADCYKVHNSSDTFVCNAKPNITLYTTAPAQSYKHLWNTGSQELSINVTRPGIYWCTGIKGCDIITDTFYVKAFNDTSVKNTDVPACGSSTLSSSFNAVEYLWNTGDTTRSVPIDKYGKYWCMAIADCKLMVDTFTVSLGIDTIRKPIHHITYCQGDSYTLSANTHGSAYKWSTGENSRSISGTNSGKYICYIYTTECEVNMEEFIVSYVTPPSSYVQHMQDTSTCGPVRLGSEYDPHPDYIWNTGDTICCITASVPGVYTVTVIEKGCPPLLDTAIVTIMDCENCVFIPTAFTPNSDGINDYFRALPSCPVDKFTIRIYNRFGQEVFTADHVNSSWNGLHGASLADVGTYFYMIEYTSIIAGRTVILKGDLLLIR